MIVAIDNDVEVDMNTITLKMNPMKKMILSSVMMILSLIAMAQKPAYMGAMGKTLSQFATAQTPAGLQQLANRFETIARAEKEEWLPLYYEAQCYILMSFMVEDVTQKDPYLDEAEKLLDKLIEMEPREAEVFALQSFYDTGRLVVNPMERGQKYNALSNQAIGKALALDPTNPRAAFLKIRMEMGAAPYMGLDPKSFCPQALKLLARWDDYKPQSPIHPNWGKTQLELLVKGCE